MLDLEPIKDRLDAISESLDPEMPGIARARRVPDDIAALIEEVERLRAELDDTKAALQDTEDDLCEARERLTDLDIDL